MSCDSQSDSSVGFAQTLVADYVYYPDNPAAYGFPPPRSPSPESGIEYAPTLTPFDHVQRSYDRRRRRRRNIEPPSSPPRSSPPPPPTPPPPPEPEPDPMPLVQSIAPLLTNTRLTEMISDRDVRIRTLRNREHFVAKIKRVRIRPDDGERDYDVAVSSGQSAIAVLDGAMTLWVDASCRKRNVEVRIGLEGNYRPVLCTARCDCPLWTTCEHIVATLLAVHAMGGTGDGTENNDDIDDVGDDIPKSVERGSERMDNDEDFVKMPEDWTVRRRRRGKQEKGVRFRQEGTTNGAENMRSVAKGKRTRDERERRRDRSDDEQGMRARKSTRTKRIKVKHEEIDPDDTGDSLGPSSSRRYVRKEKRAKLDQGQRKGVRSVDRERADEDSDTTDDDYGSKPGVRTQSSQPVENIDRGTGLMRGTSLLDASDVDEDEGQENMKHANVFANTVGRSGDKHDSFDGTMGTLSIVGSASVDVQRALDDLFS
ncbi:hypothetical protein BJ742DRAFT_835092 [Cladochytrium replicatum]|nr:hypothetical protein BJ742DRAFT_835092 [Cladochytrium replicatum]